MVHQELVNPTYKQGNTAFHHVGIKSSRLFGDPHGNALEMSHQEIDAKEKGNDMGISRKYGDHTDDVDYLHGTSSTTTYRFINKQYVVLGLMGLAIYFTYARRA